MSGGCAPPSPARVRFTVSSPEGERDRRQTHAAALYHPGGTAPPRVRRRGFRAGAERCRGVSNSGGAPPVVEGVGGTTAASYMPGGPRDRLGERERARNVRRRAFEGAARLRCSTKERTRFVSARFLAIRGRIVASRGGGRKRIGTNFAARPGGVWFEGSQREADRSTGGGGWGRRRVMNDGGNALRGRLDQKVRPKGTTGGAWREARRERQGAARTGEGPAPPSFRRQPRRERNRVAARRQGRARGRGTWPGAARPTREAKPGPAGGGPVGERPPSRNSALPERAMGASRPPRAGEEGSYPAMGELGRLPLKIPTGKDPRKRGRSNEPPARLQGKYQLPWPRTGPARRGWRAA